MIEFKLIGKLFELDIDELQVAKSLWMLDPMRTSCHLNPGMDDEYTGEARMIIALIRLNVPLDSAVKLTFDQYFWRGALKEEPTQAVIAELSRFQFTTQRTVEV